MQLEQVLLNLAINARDAMPQGGALTVVTQTVTLAAAPAAAAGLAAGTYAELLVRDAGHGMAANVLARAFEPFFTTKGPGRGTGLGLATVYGIARQSGGSAAIESAPGKGTTVRVWLPVVAAPAPALVPTPPVADAAVVMPRTVLVVDDERAVRELVQRLFVNAGHRVLVAEHGEHALAVAAAAGSIDLLVTDIVMPRLGGLELARRLCAGDPSLPVLFVSAHPLGGESADFAGFARAAFVNKPFTADELLEKAVAMLVRR